MLLQKVQIYLTPANKLRMFSVTCTKALHSARFLTRLVHFKYKLFL